NTHAITEFYTLSLHDALPISATSCSSRLKGRARRKNDTLGENTIHRAGVNHYRRGYGFRGPHLWPDGRYINTFLPDEHSQAGTGDRKSTRLNSSHVKISYAVF